MQFFFWFAMQVIFICEILRKSFSILFRWTGLWRKCERQTLLFQLCMVICHKKKEMPSWKNLDLDRGKEKYELLSQTWCFFFMMWSAWLLYLPFAYFMQSSADLNRCVGSRHRCAASVSGYQLRPTKQSWIVHSQVSDGVLHNPLHQEISIWTLHSVLFAFFW